AGGHLVGGVIDVPHLLWGAPAGEVGCEVDGVILQQPHDVRGGDDAGDLPVIDDGQVVEHLLCHEEHRLKHEGIAGGGGEVGGHDGTDRAGGVCAFRDATAQVPVGDDAVQRTVGVDDEQRAHVFALHGGGRVTDRG